jgi:hypothetical protein
LLVTDRNGFASIGFRIVSPLPKSLLSAGIVALCLGVAMGQFRRNRGYSDGMPGGVSTEGGVWVDEATVRTARETAAHSFNLPAWTNAPQFEKDVFTFVRVIFRSNTGRPSFLGWVNDYPDGDLNLSHRLQQLTSMKVDPDGRVLKLTDPALFQYPFIFTAQAGGMDLSDEEAVALRKYLQKGGAFMADDFWGDRDWENFEYQMSRVLPGRQWIDLPIEHPLFHCVYDLAGPIRKLQVPTIHLWRRGYDPDNPSSNASAFRGEGTGEMHVRAWLDDKQRIMIIALHNTDTGDGWEREGENEDYFRQFSETRAYPIAINTIVYLMTH